MLGSAQNETGQTLTFRAPNVVMDINRLGTLYPYPLSFMRVLVRKIMHEAWDIQQTHFDLCDEGYGSAVYEITAPQGVYSYVVFAKYLEPERRLDRVIADDWDMTVTLCAGRVDNDRLAFLQANVPLQENGRVDSDCFVLSRANKSVRNFEAVVSALASGQQPDLDAMAKVGYLYRTTAVYGSGKFGMADWEKVRTRYLDFASPFAAEMFSCFMIRDFSLRQADHVAKRRAPDTAVPMREDIQRYVGIGNATGLGMAPFLIRHPLLINNWIEVRETALARILAQEIPDTDTLGYLDCLMRKAVQHLKEISTDNAAQNAVNSNTYTQLEQLRIWAKNAPPADWTDMVEHAGAAHSAETQELLITLLCELYSDQIVDLEAQLAREERYRFEPDMPLTALKHLIEDSYDWALRVDFEKPDAQGTFWYRSEEKMEPRLGVRGAEQGAEKEIFMGVAKAVQDCHADLLDYILENADKCCAHFALARPEHRMILRRMQTMAKTRYGEIQANLLAEDVLPIHLLRCKLSFFGVGKFDPRSRLWVRNTMFQGAPLVSDIGKPFQDHWCFPIRPN